MANNKYSNENLCAHIFTLQAALTSNPHRTTVPDVLRLLSEPLSLLNLLPSDDAYSEWSGERADPRDCLKLIESLAWQKQLRFLLEHVIVDWLTALSEKQQRDLFEPYFIPLKRVGEEAETLRIKRRMAFASLQAITGLFVEASAALRNGDDMRFHSLLVSITTDFLERLLRQYDVMDFYQALFNSEIYNATDILKIQKMKKVEWKDFVVMLCSIPTRVANMMGGGWSVEEDKMLLNDVPFFRNLSLQTENAIWTFSQKNLMEDHNTKNAAFAFGELIGKICRLGYAKTFIQAVHKVLENHLHSTLSSSSPTAYHTIFQMITLTHLQPSDLTHLLSAYLTYIDTHVLIPVNVYNSSSSSRRIFRRVAQTLHGILGAPSPREDEDGVITRLIEDKFLLRGKAGWSVGVARVLVCWFCWNLDNEEHQASREKHVLEVLIKIFEIWSDPSFVKRGSWDQQIFITSIILLLAGHISQSTLHSSFITGELMRGIGKWLETTDEQCRKLGMATAEVLSSLTDLTGNILDFGILEPEKDKEILRLKILVEIRDGIAKADDGVEEWPVQENIEISNEEIPQATLVKDEESVEEIQKAIKYDDDDPDAPVTIRYNDDIDSDGTSSESDLEPYPMEEEEEVEDIYVPGKKNIGKPVYILDLISYLKASDDPEKLDIGLKTAEELIRRKTGVGFEVEENAIDLARSLLALENNYEFEDFYEKKEKALVSLVIAVPDQVSPYLCKKVYNKDYSISQRTSMLTALAVGARELAGWADNQDISKKPNTNTKPHTLDTLTTEMQASLAVTVAESKSITRSSVRIFSRKSAIEAARPKPQANRFGKYAARYFFYPLITGWWEGMRGGSTEKGYISIARESVLLGKLVSTLGVLLYCGTNTDEIVRMAREFWDFALALRHYEYGKNTVNVSAGSSSVVGPENSILSALLFGVTVVVSMSVKPDRKLVEEFGRELIETREWITDVLSNNQDPKIQMQCAGLVVRLREVMEEYQRQLFGDTLPI